MKSWMERILTGYCWICSFILLGCFGGIVGYLVFKGVSSVNLELLFGEVSMIDAVMMRQQVYSGLWPAIVGTISLVVLALLFAIPVGIASGIYLAEYSKGRAKKAFSLFVDILASIPSIIVGLFGFSLAVFLHQKVSDRIYPCLLISSLALAFLVLPYLIRTTQVALESIPASLRQTAPVLGASKFQNIRFVLVPGSLPALMSGIILAMGRCAEDTAVIMLTGVVASAGVPGSLMDNYEALPFFIYHISAEYSDQGELAAGYGAALILVITCMFLFGLAFLIKNRLGIQASRI
jgi:phosphate transport system permease protein